LYKELLNFCTVDLSAFYFDIRKDVLYCDPINSEKRQSTIILLKIILNSLLKWFAPILSFTTEEIYRLIKQNDKSIHLEQFIEFPKSFENTELNDKWLKLIQIRDVSNISIEEKRSTKEIGSSLEANIEIKLDKEYFEISKNIDFAELCITSKASIIESFDKNIIVETTKAKGEKCPICWKINTDPCKRHS
jgi:isoleucyl-tRNA synthetase